jgi:acetate kinase
MRILVLNAGSSSLKAALVEPPDATVARAGISWGSDASRAKDRAAELEGALGALGVDASSVEPALAAVGHRVVHGGDRFTAPALIDDEVMAAIAEDMDLAPLHNKVALEAIEVGRTLLPTVPHAACFDTAFHTTLAPEAYRYPVPERWYTDWGIRRFGFHGLSVAWSVRRAAELLGRDATDMAIVVAHLGSGCSVTAVDAGRSVDTSMGMTPLEGLMMGTRSGSIDPGVLCYVTGRGLLDPDDVGAELEHRSGLLGVSDISGDIRELQAAVDEGSEAASLALAMFVRRAAAWIAAAATTLPRLDAIVFTGGIGEHGVDVRREIVARLGVLGIPPLPAGGNEPAGDGRLDRDDDGVAILRVEAREDLVIAAQTAELISQEAQDQKEQDR